MNTFHPTVCSLTSLDLLTKFFTYLENLGHTSVHLVDILPCSLDTFLNQPSLPFTQKIYLNNGSSVVIKCVVQHLTSS
jgi:hypothetical protein